jgi:hypothetical protein
VRLRISGVKFSIFLVLWLSVLSFWWPQRACFLLIDYDYAAPAEHDKQKPHIIESQATFLNPLWGLGRVQGDFWKDPSLNQTLNEMNKTSRLAKSIVLSGSMAPDLKPGEKVEVFHKIGVGNSKMLFAWKI